MQNLAMQPRRPESQRVPTTSEMERDITGEDFYDGLSMSKCAPLSQRVNAHRTSDISFSGSSLAVNLLFQNSFVYYTSGRLHNQAARSTDDVAKFYYTQLDTLSHFQLRSKAAPPDTSILAANFSDNFNQPTLVFKNLSLEAKSNLFIQRFYLESPQASTTNILVDSPVNGSPFYWSVDSTGEVILQTERALPSFHFN